MAMKKIILFLTLSIMNLGNLQGSDIRDLSEDHPAYNIIQYLIEEEFLILRDGDEFRGGEALTRIEAAILVDKILKNVSSGEKNPNLKEADAIRLLTKEFGPDIIRIDDKLYAFEQRIKYLEDEQLKVLDDVLAIQIEVDEKLSKFENDLNLLRSELENRAIQEETKLMLEEMSLRLTSLEERMSEYDNKNADGSTDVSSQHVFWIFILLAGLGAAN